MPLQQIKFGPRILDQIYDSRGFTIGSSGTPLQMILAGTVDINPPSIGANTQGSASATITGAQTTDLVFVKPPQLASGLVFVGAAITAANTLTVYLHNVTAAAIDDTAKTWHYLLIRL